MRQWFEGKTGDIAVARGLVGNAASLIKQSYGKQIDEADIVVRINRGLLSFWLSLSGVHETDGNASIEAPRRLVHAERSTEPPILPQTSYERRS
jgi:hypothetical protein